MSGLDFLNGVLGHLVSSPRGKMDLLAECNTWPQYHDYMRSLETSKAVNRVCCIRSPAHEAQRKKISIDYLALAESLY